MSPTHDASLSRITAVLKGDESSLELCIKAAAQVDQRRRGRRFQGRPGRRARAGAGEGPADVKSRTRDHADCDIFRAKIVNLSPDSLIIEATGDDDKITALLGLLEPFGISNSPAPGGWR
jgi:acetolactate synthase-1/3 small subunit